MKTTARTLLSLVSLASVATIPLTACQDLTGDCELMRTCPEYAETGGMGGDVGDGDAGGTPGDGDGDTGGRSGGGTGGDDGDGGTGGNGSGGMVEPCGGACDGDRPLCDEGSESCVECLVESDCESKEGTPACDSSDGSCVECLNSSHCDEGVCDAEAKACVECVVNDDCEDGAPVCDIDNGNLCVECLADADCTDPSMPICGDDYSCGADCTESLQCERFAEVDAGVCDTETGGCVECTVAEDDRTIDTDACGTGVCLPETQTCDDELTQGGTDVCEVCVADNQCAVDHACVSMEFQSTPRDGGYCLKRLSTGCAAPYGVPTPSRTSLSGAESSAYCGVNEDTTTCEAVSGLASSCAGSLVCGAEGLNDALCTTVNGVAERCSYACELPTECPDAAPCQGPSGSKYCGGTE